GRRAREVRREHGGGGDRRAVGGRDDREGRGAALLDADRAPAGDETPGCGDAHGESPRTGRPSVSGRPSSTLAFWIAWPEAPFTRLSSAAIATTVPVRSSNRTVTWIEFDPVVALVCGDSSSTWTKGSDAYASR